MSLDFIYRRRSIRKFTSEPVSLEMELELLKSAMAAPSAMNLKPWHFVVVTDTGTLKLLAQAHPHGKMLTEATLAIAVIGDPEISEHYWIQDCTAATENILLAVSALNLGAVWLGCTPRHERVSAIQSILEIPADKPVLSLIAIGHPGEEKPARTQYDETRVHRNKW